MYDFNKVWYSIEMDTNMIIDNRKVSIHCRIFLSPINLF